MNFVKLKIKKDLFIKYDPVHLSRYGHKYIYDLLIRDKIFNKMIDFLKEFWEFLMERKKYWLLPIIIVLALFGALIVLSQGTVVAPFIYTIF